MKAVWIACLLVAPVWLGCAHETTTTKTTTSECVEPYDEDHPYDPDDPACERVVEEVIVTTEHGGCHGVVSCTFVVVGEVIALPFRIVGAAVDAVL